MALMVIIVIVVLRWSVAGEIGKIGLWAWAVLASYYVSFEDIEVII